MKKLLFLTIITLGGILTSQAQFKIEPVNGDPVTINGNVTFSPNADGTSYSVGSSYNTDLDLSKIKSISLAPKTTGPAVGDFFYSDGTYSSTLDASKTAIGVVFYIGDPTEQDAALKAAHPGCTHGLVVGLTQKQCEWQDNYGDFDMEVDMTVGEWIAANTDYESIATRSEAMSSPFNKILGYNNTMGIDAFNDGEYGWDYEVLVGSNVSSTVSSHKAPTSTSGWYIPSIKEVSLICSGVTDGSIGDLGYESTPDNANVTLLNTKIAQIDKATPLDGVYWSSTEYNVSQVHTVQFRNGLVMQTSKGGANLLRPILAF